jgi:hypothetical protein
MYSQPVIIQEVFMDIPVSDNIILRPVTHVDCSHFVAN